MTAVDSPLGTKKGNDGMAPRRGRENLKNFRWAWALATAGPLGTAENLAAKQVMWGNYDCGQAKN